MPDVLIVDAETGEQTTRPMTAKEQRDRDALTADMAAREQAAPPALADRLAAVEARLDKAANAAVTGDAAKLRDNLR